MIQQVLMAILKNCFLLSGADSCYHPIFSSFTNQTILYIFCNQRVRKLKNCHFANGINLIHRRVIKKILPSNQRATEAVTCVAPIFRKKVTRSFAPRPQSNPINNENRHLIDVLKNTGQTQNEAHALSAFSYSRAITRDRGTEKPFNRAGPGVRHDSGCALRWIFIACVAGAWK